MFQKLLSGKASLILSLGVGMVISVSTPTLAQVTTTYTYDANGRLVLADRDDGASNSYDYDDAGNITTSSGVSGSGSGSGGGSGNGPACSNVTISYSYSGGSWSGVQSCTDPNGGSLTLTSVTNPPGSATASVQGNNIVMSNLQCGANTTTRTVSNNGGTETSTFTINRIYHPWYAPNC